MIEDVLIQVKQHLHQRTEGAGEISKGHSAFEELNNSGQIEKLKAELKTLPAHLKYVFFEKNDSRQVIISSLLKKTEEDQLVQILKRHKITIGWHISDLKGISPSYCMHQINMEAEYKAVRQPQRRLNPIDARMEGGK